MSNAERLRPRIVAVRLDETEHWRKDILAKVKKIWAHYMFNENEHTTCCEATPSYYLRWFDFDVEVKEGMEMDEDLYDQIYWGFHDCDNDGYYHCRRIDRIPESRREIVAEPGSERMKEWVEEDHLSSDKILDRCIEDQIGNPIW